LINAAIGVWLMAAPAVLGYTGPHATSDRIVGPCIASLGIVAMGECTRSVRFWLLPLAAWLLVSAVVLPTGSTPGTMNAIGCGFGVCWFAMIRGRIYRTYGGGWTVLFTRASSKAED